VSLKMRQYCPKFEGCWGLHNQSKRIGADNRKGELPNDVQDLKLAASLLN